MSFPTLLRLPNLLNSKHFFRRTVRTDQVTFVSHIFHSHDLSTKEIRSELHGAACSIRNSDEPTLMDGSCLLLRQLGCKKVHNTNKL